MARRSIWAERLSVMALRGDSAVAAVEGRAGVRRVARWLTFTDALVLAGAITGAQVMRFGVSDTVAADPTTSVWDLEYTWVSVGIILLWLVSLRVHAAYDPRMLGHGTQEYRAVASATFRLFAALAIVSYLSKLELARGYVLVAFPVGLAGLLLARRLWRSWLGANRARGRFADAVLVVGDLDQGGPLVRDLRTASDAGFRVVAICCAAAAERVEGVPVVGVEEDAAECAQRVGADVVAYAASSRLGSTGLRRLGWALEGTGIDLVVAPGMTDVAGPRIHARPVAGLPLLYVEAPRFTGVRLAVKSAFDVVVAAVLLAALAPFFLVVGFLIKLDDHGPVFFSQRRVGQGGRSFVMTKFRSMHVGADQLLPDANDADGPLFKLREDPRVTRIGRWLRRSSIDELPQLVNVLRGEMSLVGPRPPLESEVAGYAEDARRRLLVKPGLTGLWQVSGRSDLSWEDSVRLDLYYVENWSFTSDLRILWRTVRALRERRGAY